MGKSNEVGVIPYDKSNNIETSLIKKQGRITRKDFFIRSFLCILLWGLVHLSYIYFETPNYNEWVERGGGKIQSGAVQVEIRHKIAQNIDYYILPSILLLFILIQAAKRVHDTNHSSLWLLIPFYNVYLLCSEGSANDNDYGLLPHAEVKSPSYKANKTETDSKPEQTSKQISWNHVMGGTILGVILASILLNLIAPWFISGMALWLKLALLTATILGVYFVFYAIDDNHKGKYVAKLGWCGAIILLYSTILNVYGVFGGFNSDIIEENNLHPVINERGNEDTLTSKPIVSPQIPYRIANPKGDIENSEREEIRKHKGKKIDKSMLPSTDQERQKPPISSF